MSSLPGSYDAWKLATPWDHLQEDEATFEVEIGVNLKAIITTTYMYDPHYSRTRDEWEDTVESAQEEAILTELNDALERIHALLAMDTPPESTFRFELDTGSFSWRPV